MIGLRDRTAQYKPSTEWQQFCIHAKDDDKVNPVRSLVEQTGFQYSDRAPDFVITVGGDGTFLQAEHRYPGIPKLLVRDSRICYRCHNEPLPVLLDDIQQGRATTMAIPKLEVGHSQGCSTAINDIVLRNQHPTQAIRFRVSVNGQVAVEQVIGDGIVAATSFGSTGYYRSVTRQTFDQGYGLAFNNSTEAIAPLRLSSEDEVILDITRGPGQLAVDNVPDIQILPSNEQIVIRQSQAIARLVVHK